MKNIYIKKNYIPNSLSKKDLKNQINNIKKSRKLYLKKKYINRPKLKSYKNKTSSYIINAKKKFNINSMDDLNILSKKSGCTKKALLKIVNKGEGAYYSSGSRPNQTAQSWGKARLASALLNGKAALVDYDILIKGCKINSIGYKSAKTAKKLYK